MIRRFSSLVTVAALWGATVTPSLTTCESSQVTKGDVAMAMDGPPHDIHGASRESDCPDPGTPSGGDREEGCVAMCLTMLGCSSPSFLAGNLLETTATRAQLVPTAVVAAHSSPSLAPDRPPPRS